MKRVIAVDGRGAISGNTTGPAGASRRDPEHRPLVSPGEGGAEGTDWLVRAAIAGFVATGLMTTAFAFAYGFVFLLGSADPAAPTLLRWLWGLAHNAVTQRAQTAVPVAALLHFVAGLAWAVV